MPGKMKGKLSIYAKDKKLSAGLASNKLKCSDYPKAIPYSSTIPNTKLTFLD